MTNSKTLIVYLLTALGMIAIANAQTKIDSATVIRQLQTEIPVYILASTTHSRSVTYIKGYQLAGKLLNSKHQVLPEYVIVFGVMPRKPKTK